MSIVHIEWGNLERTEAIEQDILEKSKKILTMAPDATKLVVHFRIVNPHQSAGVPIQKVSFELRLPHHQDIRAEHEGTDLYKSIRETKRALLSQLSSRKNINHTKAVDMLLEEDSAPVDSSVI